MKDTPFEHASDSLLDTPVQAACESGWQNWVQTHGKAKALPAFIGHFASFDTAEATNGADLAALKRMLRAICDNH